MRSAGGGACETRGATLSPALELQCRGSITPVTPARFRESSGQVAAPNQAARSARARATPERATVLAERPSKVPSLDLAQDLEAAKRPPVQISRLHVSPRCTGRTNSARAKNKGGRV